MKTLTASLIKSVVIFAITSTLYKWLSGQGIDRVIIIGLVAPVVEELLKRMLTTKESVIFGLVENPFFYNWTLLRLIPVGMHYTARKNRLGMAILCHMIYNLANITQAYLILIILFVVLVNIYAMLDSYRTR
jgi:hypothetical protein